MAAPPKYVLRGLLTGSFSESQKVLDGLGEEYAYMEPRAPVTIATVLESYGPEKKAEVKDAVAAAKDQELGDIQRMLEEWLAKHPAGGRRKTRKSKKTLRRKAKKSRRSYK